MKKFIKLVIFCTLFGINIKAEDSSTNSPASNAADPYPVFSLSQIKLIISTNIIGYVADPPNLVSSNLIYNIDGQVFTNEADGHFKSLAEGFTDDSSFVSPWNTLARLYGAYQNGVNSNDVKQLYTSSSFGFLNSIYGDSQVKSNYVLFATGITNMSALLGYRVGSDGFFAILKIQSKGSIQSETLPFYLVNLNGVYLLKTFDSSSARESNIGSVLNTKKIIDLLP